MEYPTTRHLRVISALLNVKNKKEAASFLRDLMTIGELDAIAERWQIATLLWTSRMSYSEIAKKIGASTTTITRVSHWLSHGMGGYRTILSRLFGPNKRLS